MCAGEQPPIVDRTLFDAIQAKFAEQRNTECTKRASSEALLMGKIYDDRGNRMSPSHARKGSRKYRYYIASPLLQGSRERLGTVTRLPATELESTVVGAIRHYVTADQTLTDAALITQNVSRVDVGADEIAITLLASTEQADEHSGQSGAPHGRGKREGCITINEQDVSAWRGERSYPPRAMAKASHEAPQRRYFSSRPCR